MALTIQEQTDIIFQLGWPGKTLIPDSTDYSKIVADRLAILNASIESIVRDLLVRVKKVDTALTDAVCRLSAKRVDDIELNPNEIPDLRREKRRLLYELSDLVDIEIIRQGNGSASVCV